MKRLIIYQSKTGVTKQVAKTIQSSLDQATIKTVESVTLGDLDQASQMIVGSPVYMTRPLKKTRDFLFKNETILKTKKTACFPLWRRKRLRYGNTS